MGDRSTRKHRNNVLGARELRARETTAEDLLWAELRGRRLAGLKFRRQHPVGPFVIDFCCAECRLAIELDGPVHDTQRERDAEPESLLAVAGYRVLRFSNDYVFNDLVLVLEAIQAAAHAQPLWHPPQPGRRSGLQRQ